MSVEQIFGLFRIFVPNHYIKMLPSGLKHLITIKSKNTIKCDFIVFSKLESDGSISAYIPNFDIYFTAKSFADREKQSKKFINSFFNYWVIHNGWDMFMIKIKEMGFIAANEAQRRALIRGSDKMKDAKLIAMTPKAKTGGYTPTPISTKVGVAA